jgi:glutamate/tyrosine decarboxylase-like PLP-dependent enzyme
MAGTALILPEFRWMLDGSEYIDSFVFNPHKWMFTNFDCTAYFVKDAANLIKTFEVLPEYLKTRTRGKVTTTAIGGYRRKTVQGPEIMECYQMLWYRRTKRKSEVSYKNCKKTGRMDIK